jgi:catechol 2,3-dioxygenase
MSAPRRFEHARLRVPDVDAATAFYTEVMGLLELGRADRTVYLGAGLDTNYDLALVAGGTGVEHFALRADGDEQLEALERALEAAGVATERHAGEGPGEGETVAFALPSGHRMEFVTVEDQRYLEPYRPAVPGRGAMGLLDADHINLTSPDARGLSEFLRDALGFRISDVIELEDGSWLGGWTRMGEFHHDVAVLLDPDPAHTLHHVAWTCESIDHLARCCDRLAAAGIRLEIGIGRHPAGANFFAYFLDPSGNRVELSAAMALVNDAMEVRVWSSPRDTFDAWGDPVVPDSFRQGM